MIEQATDQGKGLPKKWKLTNTGTRDFNYEIQGNWYHIPVGESITVSRSVKVLIKGFYPGKDIPVSLKDEPVLDGGFDTLDAPIANNIEKVRVYTCLKCDFECDDKNKLAAHDAEMHKRGPKPKDKQEA